MSDKINSKTYYAMALDPIHVGTGGYKLGRVDNTIVREPGTNIPKIPGSTINGCARTYSYYKSKEQGKPIRKACALGKKNDEDEPCGNCDICQTYGYSKGDKGSKKSEVNFSDARILLFPVHSAIGPVWITCPSVLEDCPLTEKEEDFQNNKHDKIKTNVIDKEKKLNLGWLYLENKGNLKENIFSELDKLSEHIKEKIVLVSDKVFCQVINSNLEVRTSVSIDPETGATEKGALFTYEAIPRTTVFWFDITLEHDVNKIPSTAKQGLKNFEILGVGGMTSRGFGRLRVLNLEDYNNKNNTDHPLENVTNNQNIDSISGDDDDE